VDFRWLKDTLKLTKLQTTGSEQILLQISSNFAHGQRSPTAFAYTNGEFKILPPVSNLDAEFHRVLELW